MEKWDLPTQPVDTGTKDNRNRNRRLAQSTLPSTSPATWNRACSISRMYISATVFTRPSATAR